jgi:hypothetical protein
VPRDGGVPALSGQSGPDAYTEWRATRLEAISEAIDRRLLLRLCGRGQRLRRCSMSGAAMAHWPWHSGGAAQPLSSAAKLKSENYTASPTVTALWSPSYYQ